jgi:hypothetical protein
LIIDLRISVAGCVPHHLHSKWQQLDSALGRQIIAKYDINVIDQRSMMSYVATTKKCLPRIFVRPSLRHITDTKNPCVLVLTRCHVTDINHILTHCHVTDINHVLTRCHVTEINYVDRGAAARAPLQSLTYF